MKKPKMAKITGRSSSITNAFVQAIIPTRAWSDAEEAEALAVLGQSRPNLSCVYCGDRASDWDHLRPLVRGKKPTGYIHEIRNIVPSCGPCNQSKSGADWRAWFLSMTARSPTQRGVLHLDERFSAIKRFVEWGDVKKLDFSVFNLEEDLAQHWNALDGIQENLRNAQRFADGLKLKMQKALKTAEKVA